ncbi:hypothetical protein ACM9XA_11305 [Xanthomonas sacchari]
MSNMLLDQSLWGASQGATYSSGVWTVDVMGAAALNAGYMAATTVPNGSSISAVLAWSITLEQQSNAYINVAAGETVLYSAQVCSASDGLGPFSGTANISIPQVPQSYITIRASASDQSYSVLYGYDQLGTFTLAPGQDPDPQTAVPCDEIGTVSRAYVSAHDRTRIHQINVPPGERRCVVADFNGALPPGRSIAAAEWRLSSLGVASMSGAAIPSAREAQVQVQVGYPGTVALRCVATLDNGEVYVQRYMIVVPVMPFFGDETVQYGPQVLSAVAS